MYEYEFNGLKLKTGDIICTQNGDGTLAAGQIWWLLGKLIPGEIDHIVIYTGPGPKCIEAAAKFKVVEFDLEGKKWDANSMKDQRGLIFDTLIGAAYPMKSHAPPPGKTEEEVRAGVAEYCRAQLGKPYNINFLDSETEDKFYCSQLAWAAYKSQGIDLRTDIGIPELPGTATIIFPQELWNGNENQRAG